MRWPFNFGEKSKKQSDDRKSHKFATLEDLQKLEKKVSELSDYIALQRTFNQQIGSHVDEIVKDVGGLNDKIKELNDRLNSGSVITDADKAALVELAAEGQALVAKAGAADELTPPTTPVPPVP